MQVHANAKHRDLSFEVGDVVYLKLQPYRHRLFTRFVNEKPSLWYYGHFPVITRVGSRAYRLQLPPGAKIHHVFHVSQLKKAIGPAGIPQSLPPILFEDLTLQVELERVVDTRYYPFTGQLEVLLNCAIYPTLSPLGSSLMSFNNSFRPSTLRTM